MITNEKIDLVIYQMWNDFVSRTSVIFVTVLAIFVALFYSVLTAGIAVGSYILGCGFCLCLVTYRDELFNCIPVVLRAFGCKDLQTFYSIKEQEPECDLCGNGKCSRHKPRPLRDPWKDLTVYKELDEAVQELYDKILNTFVFGWFQKMTDDRRFESSVKLSMKYASCVLLRRIKQVDFPQVITERLLPAILYHVNTVDGLTKIYPKFSVKNNPVPFDIHPALQSREDELDYLRGVAHCVMPLLLGQNSVECGNFQSLVKELLAGWVLLPLTDSLSNPAIINLIIVAASQHSIKKTTNSNQIEVEFLHNFVSDSSSHSYYGGSSLSVLFKNHPQLYSFMQYLKRINCIHLLQFCLHVDELNEILVQPKSNLDTKTIIYLNKNLLSIQTVYLKKTSTDYLGDTITISEDLLRDVEQIVQLKTGAEITVDIASPIYQLYDGVYGYLEKCLDGFYSSPEYLDLMYGPREIAELNKATANKARKGTDSQSGAVTRLSNRIRGALRVGPVEGQLPPSASGPYAGMSNWTLNIYTEYSTQPSSKNYLESVFRVNVTTGSDSLWSDNNTWSTMHRDNDFQTLRTQLGLTGEWDNFPDIKTSSAETRRFRYEIFLQSLIQSDTLSRRQLEVLYNFIAAPLENSTSSLNSQNPNIYQSVAHKLRKERGQHLEKFMATFIASVENESSTQEADVGEDPASVSFDAPAPSTHRHSSVFCDHFKDCPKSDVSISSQCIVRGPSQCLLFILVRILHAPWWVVRFTLALCCVLAGWLDVLARIVLLRLINRGITQQRIGQLIHLLVDILFESKLPTPTIDELKERHDLARKVLVSAPPVILNTIWKDFGRGLGEVFDTVQHPTLNKQLMYTLLDILIEEIFPELRNTD